MCKIAMLQTAYQTAYLDHTINSNLAYRPEFISNNYKLGKKVLVSIEEELQRCEEFCISVAFITKSGITPLLQTLKELEQKNIPGEILTTNYLMFSEPEALEKLAKLKNIELKMFVTSAKTGGFHTKGYIFREEEIYRIIIGSSNMTLSAITKNKEWNTKIVSTEQGELTHAVLQEFDALWKDEHTVAFEDFIDVYRRQYLNEKMIRRQKRQVASETVVTLENYHLKPNKMQVAFVKNVMEMRAQHIDRALLLSSTGAGKSLASAFMLREMGTKRALFVVHREQIAKQTMKSYKKVFGSSRTYGLLSGNSRDRVKGLIFCSQKDEAKELSKKFNERGWRTDVLTGEDAQERRENVIARLKDDEDIDNQLDYFFTVDIFNEGVDIPEINQVIMLRPTQSPVVFIQQLGRGLRKYDGKEYVVIIDFIGNYMNNFMIPIALSGDRSYNKDAMRLLIQPEPMM